MLLVFLAYPNQKKYPFLHNSDGVCLFLFASSFIDLTRTGVFKVLALASVSPDHTVEVVPQWRLWWRDEGSRPHLIRETQHAGNLMTSKGFHQNQKAHTNKFRSFGLFCLKLSLNQPLYRFSQVFAMSICIYFIKILFTFFPGIPWGYFLIFFFVIW